MPTYKLSYFNMKGRGELPRLLFAKAGKEFEDKRYTREQWQAYKPSSPYGVMPELEIDGKPYFQSSAIVRYLANTFGLYGQGTIAALEVDQVLGIVDDLGNVLIKVMYSKPEDKEENGRQAREEKIPNSMRLFEKLLKANGSGFFVGDSMTVADMAVYSIMDGLKVIPGDPFEGFPLTKQVVERVEADPMIRAWNDRQQQKK